MINFCKIHGFHGELVCPKCSKIEPNETQVFAGADPGRENDYFAYSDVRVQKGRARLMSTKKWLHKDYHIVVPEIAARCRRVNARALAVDATGLGLVVSEMFQREGVRVEEIKYGEYVETTNATGEKVRAPIKFDMIQYYRICAQHDVIELPRTGAEELIQQLKEQEIITGADPEHHENAKVSYGHPSGTHDDLCWAFLQALYIARPFISGNGIFAMKA